MQTKQKITHSRLLDVLDYDPSTGNFTSRFTRRSKAAAGRIAGTVNTAGYVQICIDKKLYLGHRLAWFYMHGAWPSSQIDHKNGIKTDNRIENLRLSTGSQNMSNTRVRADNTSGFKGVSFNSRSGKWAAYLNLAGRRKHLGFFADKMAAAEAVRREREAQHGEFCNHGNA